MKRPPSKHGVNGSTGASTYFPSDPVYLPNDPTPSTAKRKKITRSVQPEPNTRELRSRSKNNVDSSLTSISSRVCLILYLVGMPQANRHHVKSSLRRVDEAGRESLPLDGALTAPQPPSTSFGKSQSFQIKVFRMLGSSMATNSSVD